MFLAVELLVLQTNSLIVKDLKNSSKIAANVETTQKQLKDLSMEKLTVRNIEFNEIKGEECLCH